MQDLQGETGSLGWWSAHWLEGETTGQLKAQACLTGLKEGGSRGVIPGPCEFFPSIS